MPETLKIEKPVSKSKLNRVNDIHVLKYVREYLDLQPGDKLCFESYLPGKMIVYKEAAEKDEESGENQ